MHRAKLLSAFDAFLACILFAVAKAFHCAVGFCVFCAQRSQNRSSAVFTRVGIKGYCWLLVGNCVCLILTVGVCGDMAYKVRLSVVSKVSMNVVIGYSEAGVNIMSL